MGSWLTTTNGPCLRPSVLEGIPSLLSAYPRMTQPDRVGKRAAAWPRPRRPECVMALNWVGTGECSASQGVWVGLGQELGHFPAPSLRALEGYPSG